MCYTILLIYINISFDFLSQNHLISLGFSMNMNVYMHSDHMLFATVASMLYRISAAHVVNSTYYVQGIYEIVCQLPNPPSIMHFRSIGVSNFGMHHLVELQKLSNVPPSVNQIEVHPYLQEKDLVRYCKENNIAVQAYSPLANGRKLDDKLLVRLGTKYARSPAAMLIKWCLAQDFVCIPKSSNASRIEENLTASEFELRADDMDILDSLDENFRTCHEKIKLPWTG